MAIVQHAPYLRELVEKKLGKINKPDKENRKGPIHYAALYGTCEEFQTLLSLALAKRIDLQDVLLRQPNTNVDATDGFGYTPLHYAIFNDDVDTVQNLLQRGPDLEQHTSNGDTYLHFALRLGRPAAAVALIEAPFPDVNAPDAAADRTPLHLACELQLDSVCRALVDHGADPMRVDRAGNLPLDYLSNNEQLKEYMTLKTLSVEAARAIPKRSMFATTDLGMSVSEGVGRSQVAAAAAVKQHEVTVEQAEELFSEEEEEPSTSAAAATSVADASVASTPAAATAAPAGFSYGNLMDDVSEDSHSSHARTSQSFATRSSGSRSSVGIDDMLAELGLDSELAAPSPATAAALAPVAPAGPALPRVRESASTLSSDVISIDEELLPSDQSPTSTSLNLPSQTDAAPSTALPPVAPSAATLPPLPPLSTAATALPPLAEPMTALPPPPPPPPPPLALDPSPPPPLEKSSSVSSLLPNWTSALGTAVGAVTGFLSRSNSASNSEVAVAPGASLPVVPEPASANATSHDGGSTDASRADHDATSDAADDEDEGGYSQDSFDIDDLLDSDGGDDGVRTEEEEEVSEAIESEVASESAQVDEEVVSESVHDVLDVDDSPLDLLPDTAEQGVPASGSVVVHDDEIVEPIATAAMLGSSFLGPRLGPLAPLAATALPPVAAQSTASSLPPLLAPLARAAPPAPAPEPDPPSPPPATAAATAASTTKDRRVSFSSPISSQLLFEASDSGSTNNSFASDDYEPAADPAGATELVASSPVPVSVIAQSLLASLAVAASPAPLDDPSASPHSSTVDEEATPDGAETSSVADESSILEESCGDFDDEAYGFIPPPPPGPRPPDLSPDTLPIVLPGIDMVAMPAVDPTVAADAVEAAVDVDEQSIHSASELPSEASTAATSSAAPAPLMPKTPVVVPALVQEPSPVIGLGLSVVIPPPPPLLEQVAAAPLVEIRVSSTAPAPVAPQVVPMSATADEAILVTPATPAVPRAAAAIAPKPDPESPTRSAATSSMAATIADLEVKLAASLAREAETAHEVTVLQSRVLYLETESVRPPPSPSSPGLGKLRYELDEAQAQLSTERTRSKRHADEIERLNLKLKEKNSLLAEYDIKVQRLKGDLEYAGRRGDAAVAEVEARVEAEQAARRKVERELADLQQTYREESAAMRDVIRNHEAVIDAKDHQLALLAAQIENGTSVAGSPNVTSAVSEPSAMTQALDLLLLNQKLDSASLTSSALRKQLEDANAARINREADLEAELRTARRDLAAAQKQAKALATQLATLEGIEAKARDRAETADAELRQARDTMRSMEKQLATAQGDLQHTRESLDAAKAEAVALREASEDAAPKLRAAQQAQADAEAAVEKLKAQLAQAAQQSSKLQTDLAARAELDETIASLRSQVAQQAAKLKAELDARAGLDDTVAQLRAQLAQQATKLKSELEMRGDLDESLAQLRAQLAQQSAKAKSDLQSAAAQHAAELQAQESSFRAQLEAAQDRLAASTREQQRLAKSAAAMQDEHQAALDKLARVQRAHDQAAAELAGLREQMQAIEDGKLSSGQLLSRQRVEIAAVKAELEEKAVKLEKLEKMHAALRDEEAGQRSAHAQTRAELAAARAEAERLALVVQELESKRAIAGTKLDDARRELEEVSGKAQRLESLLAAAQRTTETQLDELVALKEEREKLTSTVRDLRRSREERADEAEHATETARRVEAANATLRKTAEEQVAQVAALTTENGRLESLHQSVKKTADLYHARIEQLTAEREAAAQKLAQVKAEHVEAVGAMADVHRKALAASQAQASALEVKVTELDTAKRKADVELAAAQDRLAQLTDALEDAETKRDAAVATAERAKEDSRVATVQLASARSDLDSAEAAVRQLQTELARTRQSLEQARAARAVEQPAQEAQRQQTEAMSSAVWKEHHAQSREAAMQISKLEAQIESLTLRLALKSDLALDAAAREKELKDTIAALRGQLKEAEDAALAERARGMDKIKSLVNELERENLGSVASHVRSSLVEAQRDAEDKIAYLQEKLRLLSGGGATDPRAAVDQSAWAQVRGGYSSGPGYGAAAAALASTIGVSRHAGSRPAPPPAVRPVPAPTMGTAATGKPSIQETIARLQEQNSVLENRLKAMARRSDLHAVANAP
ncbi:hypothetical protein H9P43_002948 [Blastocladiella emersonii ATCC 22665]|nr:hypothetical protein H9P43_002948 [Blastocladiella emersonii ATCC 22665]